LGGITRRFVPKKGGRGIDINNKKERAQEDDSVKKPTCLRHPGGKEHGPNLKVLST